MTLRTELGKVRGLGSAKTGTGHWWLQRLTALALIPLTIWFVTIIVRMVSGTDMQLLMIIASPFNTVMLLLLLGTMLYHGLLGMKVIIEDYVHNEFTKLITITLLQFATILTAVAGACAIIVFHLSLFSVTM